jgi:flagellar basal-body rod protein FlgC
MSSIPGTALSGMQAATEKLAAGASNIANSRSVGTPGAAGAAAAYAPLDVIQTSRAGGGVHSRTVTRDPATLLTYQPGHPGASHDGYVATPNVDIATELVNNSLAQHAYKANIQTMKAWDDMQQSLLDITS